MKFFFLLLVLFTSFFSCKNNINNTSNISNNIFKYENLKIKIPDNYKKDKTIINRWIDKKTGVSLNIEIEYSENELKEYVKAMIFRIKKVYPDYKIIEKKIIKDNIASVLSTSTIQDIKLKYYMLIIKLENLKIILTIGGREKVFIKEYYSNFIDLVKVKLDEKK